ncbi:UDP-glucose 4-epimerase GalE [Stenotrophomonas maltophilia]|uniref:UDP-glucose 4-epimerase GalE n=1 Tax=Stenotrophomonas maltophilia TaxID=40324 RepID=UPI0013D98F0B|nr:UDP-glucose 4-epimerase GalE [Stenotrophomonas maltophilia]MBN4978266.1 UDP-glucose 4-epimerase GalE [Stenotrophomonas maltophilia]NRP00509.1 UDP-glucose 4-epimerase GalE [Stenotrophomonas maltophilia]
MNVLVTGGAGYIGSHACVELQQQGHGVVIVDSLCNSDASVVERIGRITGTAPVFVQADIRDRPRMAALMQEHAIDAVLHFAALKSVGESQKIPLQYFDSNISGSIALLGAMQDAGVQLLVFSSSATVYGNQDHCPVAETASTCAMTPYGRTKLVVEQLLADLAATGQDLHIATLRYFNPVGAHASALIGELPHGTPSNLMPYIAQVAAGLLPEVQVFGDDYPTHDGTGVRDYIHVHDVASAHVLALQFLRDQRRSITLNLGTGQGHSVLELIQAFELTTGVRVPFRIVPRRDGDIAVSFADASLALRELGWKARHDLTDMCRDTWKWQRAMSRTAHGAMPEHLPAR